MIQDLLQLLKYTTSGFFIFIGSYSIIAMLLYFGVNGVLKITSRVIRMIVILFRGWPPNHLDADGDHK